jgi:hypothetical protein
LTGGVRYFYISNSTTKLGDSELLRADHKLAGTIALLILSLILMSGRSLAQPTNPSLPGISMALAAVNRAEGAGATTNETLPLVILLNQALELENQASTLPTNQSEQRTAIMARANQILTNVTNRANNLTTLSAQKTSVNRILTYVVGLIAALLGTLALALVSTFRQKHRIERTFKMRVKRA